MNLKAIIHDAEEGGIWAEVPALPGCVTRGDSIEEVTIHLREAIDGWLAVDGVPDPLQLGVYQIEATSGSCSNGPE